MYLLEEFLLDWIHLIAIRHASLKTFVIAKKIINLQRNLGSFVIHQAHNSHISVDYMKIVEIVQISSKYHPL